MGIVSHVGIMSLDVKDIRLVKLSSFEIPT